eukprot:5394654-Lingulodinium_polyedra.AAC.1
MPRQQRSEPPQARPGRPQEPPARGAGKDPAGAGEAPRHFRDPGARVARERRRRAEASDRALLPAPPLQPRQMPGHGL